MTAPIPLPLPLPPEPRGPRVPVWLQLVFVIAGVLVVVAAVLAGSFYNVNLSGDNTHLTGVISKQQDQIAQLAKNNDALHAQVEATGEHPVAPRSDAVTGGSTPTDGKNGTNGLNGLDGQNGRSVVALACQSDGTWLVTYDDKTSQQLTGPCIGAAGAAGQAGQPGTTGATGETGAAGQPPYSWTGTDTFGLAYTCTRTSTFDPAQPTYVCAAN